MGEARRVVSLSAYARHRGTSRQYISRLAREGVLVMREGFVDVEASDAVLDDRPVAFEPKPSFPSSPTRESAALPGHQPTSFAQARLAEMVYRAKLRRLEFEERTGKLLSREEVETAAFNISRTVRDGMLNISDRVAAMLAAESDAKKVHEILSAEIRKALFEFAEGLQGLNWGLRGRSAEKHGNFEHDGDGQADHIVAG